LRPLFWTAVNQVPEGSLFDELQAPAPFDAQALEKHFALSQPRAAGSAALSAPPQRRPGQAEEPRKRLRILDEKSSQLLAITFSRLPPPERVASTLRTLEDFPECLPPEGVQSLYTAACEQKEAVEQLRQMDIGPQDMAQLDTPERYLWVLSSIADSSGKLACGALLVGPARELADLRKATEKVVGCCQALKTSDLVRRCASTGLAVGNFMNRGTARCNARAVVLPDSLLKFEELRGVAQEAEEGEGAKQSEGRGPTLLDIVAQALIDDGGIRSLPALREESERLRSHALAAKGVSVEDAEANCKQVCGASSKAYRAIQPDAVAAAKLPPSAATLALTDRVRRVCEEAEECADRVQVAKAELAATQKWSAAKAGTKGEEWFSNWALFFEQLGVALSRTRLRRPAEAKAPQVPPSPQQQRLQGASPSRPVASAQAHAAPPSPCPRQTVGSLLPLQVNNLPQPSAATAAIKGAEKKSSKVVLDDEARVEDMGGLMEFLQGSAAAGPGAASDVVGRAVECRPASRAAGKENALSGDGCGGSRA